jgi:predicted nucleic-acid-binding protein
MISLDTNVLVRYLTQDDDAQFQAVLRLLSKKNATYFVCNWVVTEVDWVLRRLYEWTSSEVADAIGLLLSVHNLVFEHENHLRASLRTYREGADLSDELIVRVSRDLGAAGLVTFDRQIQKRHPKFAKEPS